MLTVSHSSLAIDDHTTVVQSLASMAHHADILAPASLRDLPVEVHVLVMENLADFPTLKKFIYAFPKMARIFKGFQKRILTGVLGSSGLTLQLQKIITAIMTLREQDPATPCPIKLFFDRYLDQKDQPVDMMKFSNPIRMLRYIARTMESVNEFAESFILRRIFGRGMPEIPLSDTESYRVHRAYWRFQLCYELSHPGGSVDVKHNAEPPERWSRRYIGCEPGARGRQLTKDWLCYRKLLRAPLLMGFLQTLYPWEIEELNVARFHLITQVNAFQYNRIAGTSDDLRNQNLLMQRLVMDLDKWHEDSEIPRDHLLVVDLRVPRRPDLYHEPIWLDNPLEACSVNAEPNLLNGLSYSRAQWGWCMWDVARLHAIGFIVPSFYIEYTSTGNPLESIFRNIHDIPALIEAQYSAIDKELSKRFCSDLQWQLQLYALEIHDRRKSWLRNWVKSRDLALFQEWLRACTSPNFNLQVAETCYLRAMTIRRQETQAYRNRARP